MLEKTLESPLDCKEIQPVHPKGDQSWIFTGRSDAELKLQYFGHLMQRANSLEKTLMLEKDWRQEEKGTTEDEMVGLHHWLNGHEFEQAMGVSDGQGSLVCCSPWGHRVRHDWVTKLNWDGVNFLYWSYVLPPSVGGQHSILLNTSISFPPCFVHHMLRVKNVWPIWQFLRDLGGIPSVWMGASVL